MTLDEYGQLFQCVDGIYQQNRYFTIIPKSYKPDFTKRQQYLNMCCFSNCRNLTHHQHNMCFKHLKYKKDKNQVQLRYLLDDSSRSSYNKLLKYIKQDTYNSDNITDIQKHISNIKREHCIPSASLQYHFEFLCDAKLNNNYSIVLKNKDIDVSLILKYILKYMYENIKLITNIEPTTHKTISLIKIVKTFTEIKNKCNNVCCICDCDSDISNYIKQIIKDTCIDTSIHEQNIIINIIKNTLFFNDDFLNKVNKQTEQLKHCLTNDNNEKQIDDDPYISVYADIIKNAKLDNLTKSHLKLIQKKKEKIN